MDINNFSNNPKLRYIQLFMANKIEESKRLKFDIIPPRLFRYQPVADCRIKTLSENELFLSPTYDFDDPYDSMGVFWDSQKLHEILQEKNFNRSPEDIDAYIAKLLNNIRKKVKTVCFSEDLDNLPLWGTYADKNKGFVTEYNFKQLGINSNLTKYLYPVLYEPYKISLTGAFSHLFESLGETNSPLVYVLYFHQLVKHESWSYQKEWRLLSIEGEKTIKLPIKPSAIYAGVRSDQESRKSLREIAKQLGCQYCELRLGSFTEEKFVYNLEPFP